MNKFKNLKLLSICFLVLIFLSIAIFTPLSARTVKMLKYADDIFQIMGSLVVEKDVVIGSNTLKLGAYKNLIYGNIKSDSDPLSDLIHLETNT
ncbi:MAG: hypothetical protein ABH808_03505 [Candidatus Kuenenbacteria bacterium]